MSTTNRIVLLSSQGDELFSGSSLLVEPAPPTLPAVAPLAPRGAVETQLAPAEEEEPPMYHAGEDLDDEPVPETLRSSVFVRAHEPVSRPIVIEMEAGMEVDQQADHRAA